MTPPNRYPVKIMIGHDWCCMINSVNICIKTNPQTFHLNVGSTPNNFLICGYFSAIETRGSKYQPMWYTYKLHHKITFWFNSDHQRYLLKISTLLLACGSSWVTHSKSVLVTEFPISVFIYFSFICLSGLFWWAIQCLLSRSKKQVMEHYPCK